MKKVLILMIATFLAMTASAQSEKVVVNANGEPVGIYQATNANTYSVLLQDDFEVPIDGHKIVTFTPEAGQGVVVCAKTGSINVRSMPSTTSAKVGKMTMSDGELPESYPCLGKENGWYKVRIGKTDGYVREDLVEWMPFDLY